MNLPKSVKSLAALSLIPLLLATGISASHAQQTQDSVITLDDSSATADIIITLDNNAPGAVYVEMNGAQAVLTDTTGPASLKIADKRISSFSFTLRQASSAHKLHFERLAGVTSAQVYIKAQTDLPPGLGTAPVSSSPNVSTVSNVTLTGTMSTTLHVAPALMLPITASDSANMLSMRLPDQPETAQLLDATGAPILTKDADNAITGLAVGMLPGQYSLSVLNSDATAQADVHLSLSPAPASQLALLTTKTAVCSVQIGNTTANLRSGPGTGYSITGHADPKDTLPVGGVNKQGGWLLVQGKTGAAWVAASLVTTSGTCTGLTSYDIPVRNMVVAAPPTAAAQAGSGGGGSAPPVVIAPPPPPPGGGGGREPGDGGGD